MKRKLLWLCVLTSVLWAGVVGAGQAASYTLGPAAIFTGNAGDMLTFPSETGNWGNLVCLDLDSFPFFRDRMSLTAVWSDEQGKLGAVGLAFGELDNQAEFKGLIASLNEAIANHPLMSPRNTVPFPDGHLRLMYAREAEPVIVGLSAGMASGSRDYDFSDTIPQDAVKRQAESGIWSLDAGASAIISENIYLQAALGIQGLSFSSYFELSGADPLYWERVESRQGGAKRLDLRMFYGWGDQVMLVPSLALNSFSAGYLTSYADSLHLPGSSYNRAGGEYNRRELELRIGTEYRPSKRVKLLAGIVLGSKKVEIVDSNSIWLISSPPAGPLSKRTESTITLPGCHMGLEARFLDRLTLRLGASQRTIWVKEQNWYSDLSARESSYNKSEYLANVGLGVRFGNLSIDAQLSPNQPFEAGYLLSGTAGAPFARLSAEYQY